MSNDTLDRRTFLALTGTVTVSGLAGCATSGQPAGDSADAKSPAGGTPTDDHEESESDTHADGEDGHDQETDHHEEDEHHEEDTHSDGGHGTEGPAAHVSVEMQTTDSGDHFHPHVAWVEPGGTVTFTNESGSHTVTAYHPDNDKPQRVPDGAESFDSGLLTESGDTFEYTFDTEGVYDVYCAPHEETGMIGSVLVGSPDAHDQPGLADPQEDMSESVSSKIASLNDQVNSMLGHEH